MECTVPKNILKFQAMLGLIIVQRVRKYFRLTLTMFIILLLSSLVSIFIDLIFKNFHDSSNLFYNKKAFCLSVFELYFPLNTQHFIFHKISSFFLSSGTRTLLQNVTHPNTVISLDVHARELWKKTHTNEKKLNRGRRRKIEREGGKYEVEGRKEVRKRER